MRCEGQRTSHAWCVAAQAYILVHAWRALLLLRGCGRACHTQHASTVMPHRSGRAQRSMGVRQHTLNACASMGSRCDMPTLGGPPASPSVCVENSASPHQRLPCMHGYIRALAVWQPHHTTPHHLRPCPLPSHTHWQPVGPCASAMCAAHAFTRLAPSRTAVNPALPPPITSLTTCQAPI